MRRVSAPSEIEMSFIVVLMAVLLIFAANFFFIFENLVLLPFENSEILSLSMNLLYHLDLF